MKKKKLEHMTNLDSKRMVMKTDPRIALRGKLDTFQAELLVFMDRLQRNGELDLAEDLEDILFFCRDLLAAEVLEKPFTNEKVIGLTAEELRAVSHNPMKHFGITHVPPDTDMGSNVIQLNRLRAMSREVEIQAVRAFCTGLYPKREDILKALNRLSSALYILQCKEYTGKFEKKDSFMDNKDIQQIVNVVTDIVKEKLGNQCDAALPESDDEVIIEVSNRHVHLSEEDIETFFGKGYELTRVKDLSQPGQFAAKERVSLIGPKGRLDNVAILGPAREHTQVELSMTDARTLGVKAPIRLSGDLEGSGDVFIMCNGTLLEAKESAIVAKNHIHMTPAVAEARGFHDGQKVSVKVCSERPVVFQDVPLRVSEKAADFMHIDFDEANSCSFKNGDKAYIITDDGVCDGLHFEVKADAPCAGGNTEAPCAEAQKKCDRDPDVECIEKGTKLITESRAKEIVKAGKKKVHLYSGTLVTALAKDYLTEHRCEIQIEKEN